MEMRNSVLVARLVKGLNQFHYEALKAISETAEKYEKKEETHDKV